jgi:hypothetical protein
MRRERDPLVRERHSVRIAARQEVEVAGALARGLHVVHPHDLRPAGLERLVADGDAEIDETHDGLLMVLGRAALAVVTRGLDPRVPLGEAVPS